jgi:hypothetical protein
MPRKCPVSESGAAAAATVRKTKLSGTTSDDAAIAMAEEVDRTCGIAN